MSTKYENVFIADNARVIGNVALGEDCSIWFGAVIRGDVEKITLGPATNVQDLAIIHADPGVPTTIGREVVIGHGAIVHGASVDDNSLIGMRATLLNHSKVGKYCIIGAHSLVTEGTVIPDFSIVMGSPAKVVKTMTDQQKIMVKANAAHYVALSKKYLEGQFDD